MTNTQIILDYKVANEIDLDAPFHTYQVWNRLGYKVKKGEKSQHKIAIWKPSTKKVEVENEEGEIEEKTNGRFFLKLSAFFTEEQVEKVS